jgi:hypothetical protein
LFPDCIRAQKIFTASCTQFFTGVRIKNYFPHISTGILAGALYQIPAMDGNIPATPTHRRKTHPPTTKLPHNMPCSPKYAIIEVHIMPSGALHCSLAGLFLRPLSISPPPFFKRKIHPDHKNDASGVSCRTDVVYAPDWIRAFCGHFQKWPFWKTGHFT